MVENLFAGFPVCIPHWFCNTYIVIDQNNSNYMFKHDQLFIVLQK